MHAQKQLISLLCATSLCCLSFNALGDSNNSPASEKESKKEQKGQWTFGVGIAAARFSHYLGSEQSRSVLLPFPYIHYQSKTTTIDRDGIKRNFLTGKNWDITLSGSGEIRVESEDNRARTGMPDLDWVLAIGPVLNYHLKDDKSQSIRWHIRKAFTFDDGIESVGWLSNLGLRQRFEMPDIQWGQADLTASVNLLYGSSKYNNYFYGVAPQYATATRAKYQADAGFAGSQLTLVYSLKNHPNQDKFRANIFLRATNLNGSEFEHSPLVTQTTNVNFGVSYAWLF